MKKYDYILVGSGLYAGVFAWYARKNKKRCLVVEKRNHIGGNVYCEDVEGIHVHKYGAHIFHTGNRKVWEFVNSLAEFNRYTNSPVANYKGQMVYRQYHYHLLTGVLEMPQWTIGIAIPLSEVFSIARMVQYEIRLAKEGN